MVSTLLKWKDKVCEMVGVPGYTIIKCVHVGLHRSWSLSDRELQVETAALGHRENGGWPIFPDTVDRFRPELSPSIRS
jgi:hypothetical protein